MGLLVVILIILSLVCFWRGKVILDDFPSPRIVYCYKIISTLHFIISIVFMILAIVIIIFIFED